MTRKTMEQLAQQSEATFPDNNEGQITPAILRAMQKDMIDTLTPIYAGLAIQTPVNKELTPTPVRLSFDTILGQYPPDWTVTLDGMTRSLNGLSGVNTRFSITGVIEGLQNAEITVVLRKNGTPTAWKTSSTLTGPGKPNSFTLNGLEYGTVDAAYEIWLNTESTTPTVLLRDWLWIGENIPVRTVVGTFMA